MPERLERTPLYALHAELGARFTPFAGYEMPVQYREGLRAEHLHTRSHAGLFDVSHMGQVRVTGPRLFAALERALPLDFDDWSEGVQRYSVLLNDRGGIEDDLMVTRLPGEVRIVVNAACKEKDLAVLRKVCPGLTFELLDAALVALQGPQAEAAFPDAGGLPFMRGAWYGKYFVSRSGYTGEDGFEISVSVDHAERLAKALLEDSEVLPIGLGARDSLRLEAGLCLYGHDIDTTTTPIEGALEWSIQKSRRHDGARAGGFPGADQILSQLEMGAPRRRVGLRPEGRAPVREGAPLFADAASSLQIGAVTSGGFGPSINTPVAMGYLPASHAAIGGLVFAELRGQRLPLRVAAMPFIPNTYKR